MAQQVSGSEPPRPRSRWLGFLQILLILAVIAAALYYARAPERVVRGAESDLTDERAKPAVSVIRPTPTEQALTVELTGSVRLRQKATVVSEVVGRVVWVSPKFRSGGSIAADEPFVRVDPSAFELEVEAAELVVREAEAKAWLERARGEQAAESFASGRPGEEVPDLVRRAPLIAIAEAALGRARVTLKQARLQLERTNISLPYDSRVVSSDVEVGELVGSAELVGAASRLGVVYRTGALEVDAPIEPRDLGYLAPAIGRSARVHAQGRTYEAQVVRESSVVAPKTRLASLFLSFREEGAPRSLPRPGTFAEIAITGPAYGNVYVLPESARQERGSVWIVEDGVLRSAVPRALGRTDDGWVVEAFDAGEGVVVGTLPGARTGLAVVVKSGESSG